MLDQAYLVKGIVGLARAIDGSWNQGHFGCAVLTTFFMCRDHALDPAAERGIKGELDRMIQLRSALFEPWGSALGPRASLDPVLEALGGSIDKLCHGGHNVIYAALALKALHALPEMAQPQMVSGIARLLHAFAEMPVQQDFRGIDVRDLRAGADEAIPPYVDAGAIAEITFREILAFDPMYYEIQGIVGHLVTHAHALVILSDLEYGDLAQRAYAAHKEHLLHARLLHDRFDKSRWTPVQPAHPDPMNPLFWEQDREAMARDSWGYAHFFKYRYQFYDLLARLQDVELQDVCQNRMADYVMNDFKSQGRMPPELYVPL